jgi:hypothetical protein
MSYNDNSELVGNCVFNNKLSACPIPPAAPNIAIFIIPPKKIKRSLSQY